MKSQSKLGLVIYLLAYAIFIPFAIAARNGTATGAQAALTFGSLGILSIIMWSIRLQALDSPPRADGFGKYLLIMAFAFLLIGGMFSCLRVLNL